LEPLNGVLEQRCASCCSDLRITPLIHLTHLDQDTQCLEPCLLEEAVEVYRTSRRLIKSQPPFHLTRALSSELFANQAMLRIISAGNVHVSKFIKLPDCDRILQESGDQNRKPMS
jgi:hypothetical protein